MISGYESHCNQPLSTSDQDVCVMASIACRTDEGVQVIYESLGVRRKFLRAGKADCGRGSFSPSQSETDMYKVVDGGPRSRRQLQSLESQLVQVLYEVCLVKVIPVSQFPEHTVAQRRQ